MASVQAGAGGSSAVLTVALAEFASPLPKPIRTRWGPWKDMIADMDKSERAQALREARGMGVQGMSKASPAFRPAPKPRGGAQPAANALCWLRVATEMVRTGPLGLPPHSLHHRPVAAAIHAHAGGPAAQLAGVQGGAPGAAPTSAGDSCAWPSVCEARWLLRGGDTPALHQPARSAAGWCTLHGHGCIMSAPLPCGHHTGAPVRGGCQASEQAGAAAGGPTCRQAPGPCCTATVWVCRCSHAIATPPPRTHPHRPSHRRSHCQGRTSKRAVLNPADQRGQLLMQRLELIQQQEPPLPLPLQRLRVAGRLSGVRGHGCRPCELLLCIQLCSCMLLAGTRTGAPPPRF